MNAQSSLQELKRELAARGYLRRRPLRIMAELWVFVAATPIGVCLLLTVPDNFLVGSLAMLLVAWSSLGVATNAHMASHGAISTKRWANTALAYFGYPFFLQVSLSYWRHKHIVVHHPQPNLVGKDDDVDLAPIFAINEDEIRAASGVRRWFYRYQWAFLPILLFGNAFSVIIKGWIYLYRQMRYNSPRKSAHWLDLSALLLHLAVWVVLPLAYFSLTDVITFTILRFGLTSYGMFALFAPAHFPAEAILLGRNIETRDPVFLQTVTTVNFRTGFFGRLLCAGVEYQIEHHLFPSIAHVFYPEVSKLLRRFCEAHGYPYRTIGWWEGIWKSCVTFYRPKRIFSDVEQAMDYCRGGGRAGEEAPMLATEASADR